MAFTDAQLTNQKMYLEEVRQENQRLRDLLEYERQQEALRYGSSDGMDGGVYSGDLVDTIAEVIGMNEGSYTTINQNDNGATSIGKLQWRANRAKNLLRSIPQAENQLSALGLNFGVDWSHMIFTNAQVNRTKTLLGSPEGKSAQDNLIRQDVQSYINKANEKGITSPDAVAYFADLYNQSPKQALRIANAASSKTLDGLHNAAMANPVMSKYRTRRNKTYNAIKNTNWDMTMSSSGGGTPSTGTAIKTFGPVSLNSDYVQINTNPNVTAYPDKIILPTGSRRVVQAAPINFREKHGHRGLVQVNSPYLNFVNPGQNYLDPKMHYYMEQLYKKVGPRLGLKKLTITSGWRSPSYNRRVGAGRTSAHVSGWACDIAASGNARFVIADAAYYLNFGGIAVGNSFVHVDISAYGRWDYNSVNFKYISPSKHRG